MSSTHRSRYSSTVSVLLVALLLLTAAGLSACGGTKTSPGGPSGTGAPSAEGLVVADDGRTVVFGVLNGAGIAGDSAYVYMNYTSEAKDEIVVQGSLKDKDGKALSKVTVKNEGGTWKVIGTE